MISVIIPTCNRAPFLKEAIQSVLDQDYFISSNLAALFELLIIDDGSTDNTKEIVMAFGDKVKYHYQTNKGISASRNLGLRLAKGDYVAFLDSDDLWSKAKLRMQMNLMKHLSRVKACIQRKFGLEKVLKLILRKSIRSIRVGYLIKFYPFVLLAFLLLYLREKFSRKSAILMKNCQSAKTMILALDSPRSIQSI